MAIRMESQCSSDGIEEEPDVFLSLVKARKNHTKIKDIAIDKTVLDILIFTREPMTVREISEHLNKSISGTYKIVAAMHEVGLLAQTGRRNTEWFGKANAYISTIKEGYIHLDRWTIKVVCVGLNGEVLVDDEIN